MLPCIVVCLTMSEGLQSVQSVEVVWFESVSMCLFKCYTKCAGLWSLLVFCSDVHDVTLCQGVVKCLTMCKVCKLQTVQECHQMSHNVQCAMCCGSVGLYKSAVKCFTKCDGDGTDKAFILLGIRVRIKSFICHLLKERIKINLHKVGSRSSSLSSLEEQARKPRSYSSSKLRPSHPHSLTDRGKV